MDYIKLPIYGHKREILEALEKSAVVVIEAPTGSGKTTQLPKIAEEYRGRTLGRIGMTQPRRIAAVSVSSRIAYERGETGTTLTSYKIRFDDQTSEKTFIKVMTDGILLQELKKDPYLNEYSVMIIDEAHERSLNVDFILGLLKTIIKTRPDFRVIISSATINASVFSRFFDNAPVVFVKTYPFAVQKIDKPLKSFLNEEELLEKIALICEEIENSGEEGDVLVFLYGESIIKKCALKLTQVGLKYGGSFEVLPLYARLSPAEQNRVFDTFPGKRKIVIATNIAETSITLDGVVYVIDSGIVKLNYYNASTFSSSLETVKASKASIKQRRGRAGRTKPGVVYRLYHEKDALEREDFTKEEIYRSDLSEVVLRMLDLGIKDIFRFPFISPPKRGFLYSAVDTLESLGALNRDEMTLTDIGSQMTDFPVNPRHSRILLEGMISFPEVLDHLLIITAFLSIRSPFLFPAGYELESRRAHDKLKVGGGDFFTWISVFHKYTAQADKENFCKTFFLDERLMGELVNIKQQLEEIVMKKQLRPGTVLDHKKILRCAVSGLIQYAAKETRRGSGVYKTAHIGGIKIHPSSFLFRQKPPWIICGEIFNAGRLFASAVTEVPEEIMKHHFPAHYKAVCQFDDFKDKSTGAYRKERTKPFRLMGQRFSFKEGFLEIPWEKLTLLKKKRKKLSAKKVPDFPVKITIRGIPVVSDGFKNILKYFYRLPFDHGIIKRWPLKKVLRYPEDWHLMIRHIPDLLCAAVAHKKATRAGFLTLAVLAQSRYEFVIEYDFFTSSEISFTALETLTSESVKIWNKKEKKVIQNAFHRLSS